MSKLRNDKINFNENDFVVQIGSDNYKDDEISQSTLEKNRSEQIKHDIILSAQKEKEELIKNAVEEKEKIIEEAQKKAQEIINSATLRARENEENSKKQAEELLKNSQEELEQNRIKATHDGYQDGYKDAQEKIIEELEEKLEKFNSFCKKTNEIRQKVLKSASKDILNIIQNISQKIILKELDGNSLDKIIKKTISLLEKKEDIKIIVSKKYAQILFEFQKKNLVDDIELKFEEFKQYENFEILYNQDLDDDTIIVENLKERLDASIVSQLDIIMRNIQETNSSKEFDLKEYQEENKDDEIE